MAAIITSKFRLDTTNKFVASLSDNQFYMALGRPNAWTDDSVPTTPYENDYTNNTLSTDIPKTSYIPGTTAAVINTILPDIVGKNIQEGLRQIGNQMKGYLTNEAVVHAPESRSSSPVRILRDRNTMEHPQIKGLYPCGEGAGYAGGIISAAIDGEKCADKC